MDWLLEILKWTVVTAILVASVGFAFAYEVTMAIRQTATGEKSPRLGYWAALAGLLAVALICPFWRNF